MQQRQKRQNPVAQNGHTCMRTDCASHAVTDMCRCLQWMELDLAQRATVYDIVGWVTVVNKLRLAGCGTAA